MSDYEPTTEEVFNDYVAYQSSEVEDFTGDPIPEGIAGERFSRWFLKMRNDARIEAWERGYLAGYSSQHFRDTTKPHPANPYRKESQ